VRLYRAAPSEREVLAATLAGELARDPSVVVALLHGSFLHGAFRDIDIAVGFTPETDRLGHSLDLASRLGGRVRYPVDVRPLDDGSLGFRFRALQGRLLVCRDARRLADLMERTVQCYLDLQPLLRRATIEAFGQ
jgi:predicted nucleotidyltransferase